MHLRDDSSFYPRFKIFLILFIIYPMFLVLRIFQFELWVNCCFNCTRLKTSMETLIKHVGLLPKPILSGHQTWLCLWIHGYPGSCVSKPMLLHLW